MKTATDPRHQKRISLMQKLFAYGYQVAAYDSEINLIVINIKDIDSKIQLAAPEWPLLKIAKIDLAILRLSVYELAVEKKEPPKVIIDEAVELAKEFGNQNSPQFINGVLGTIYKGNI
jgi:transcription antitermination protein NusB